MEKTFSVDSHQLRLLYLIGIAKLYLVVVRAGQGGSGAAGGLGGCGGIGGDVVFVGDDRLSLKEFGTILSRVQKRYYREEIDASLVESLDNKINYPIIDGGNGKACKGHEKWGVNGKNATLRVPTRVTVINVDTGECIGEISHHNDTLLAAKGGDPGRGIR